jgi:exosortase
MSDAQAHPPIALDPPRSVVARLAERDTRALVVFGVTAAAFEVLFFRWFLTQLGPGGFSASYPEDWAHAYFVPLIAAFFVWRERERLLASSTATFWPGLVLVSVGILTYVYFVIRFPNHMFQGAALIVTLAGLVLFLLGPRVLAITAMPIGYLALGVTISERVMNTVTFKLKLLASQGSHWLLTAVGVDNDLAGNLLTVYPPGGGAPIPLNVAEACSGMRMVIAFIALAMFVAFMSCRFWWQRIALVVLAVPVALLMNVLRVAVLAVLGILDPELSVGEAHTFIGTLLLVPAFVLFMGCVWALNRMVEDQPDQTPPAKTA